MDFSKLVFPRDSRGLVTSKNTPNIEHVFASGFSKPSYSNFYTELHLVQMVNNMVSRIKLRTLSLLS